MVTMGAITAARGGDLEDIALSVGTAYLGSSAGAGVTSSISSTFSSTFIEAGVNETFSEIAGNSITKGLINGTIAEVKGGNFEDGFAGGAVGGLVAGGVGEVANFVKPDIVNFAMENGLDLRDATAAYNAGVRAVSAGVTSEVTGRNDFVTSFSSSLIGSGVDYGVRSINQQFDVVATSWNNQDGDRDPIDLTVEGQGIPNNLVGQVQVSDIGVNNTASTSTFDAASVLGDTFNRDTGAGAGNVSTADADEIDDGTPIPQGSVTVTQAPTGETADDFVDLLSTAGTTSSDNVLDDTLSNISSNLSDVAENLPTDEDADVGATVIANSIPVGALATASDALQSTDLLDSTKQDKAVLSEAPVVENLLTAGLAQDKPEGGLNAVSQTAPQNKTDSLMGFKATDITKPLVVTAGNLLKQGLTQPKRQAPRPMRPAGGLQLANARPMAKRPAMPPPPRMDVSKLTPIKKAAPAKRPTTGGPPTTLASNANLTPVKNITGLTSLVKKTG
jgi:hypothetical protein